MAAESEATETAKRKRYGLLNEGIKTLSGWSDAVEILTRLFQPSKTHSPTASINSQTNIPRVNRPTTIIQMTTKQDEVPKPKPTERPHLSRRSEKIGLSLFQKTETMRNPVVSGRRSERNMKNVKGKLISPLGRRVVPQNQSL